MGGDGGAAQRRAERRARRDARKAAERAEQQQRAFTQQLESQRQSFVESQKAMIEEAAAPQPTGATVGAGEQGVTTRRSRRRTAKGMGQGLSSLRIPLNISQNP